MFPRSTNCFFWSTNNEHASYPNMVIAVPKFLFAASINYCYFILWVFFFSLPYIWITLKKKNKQYVSCSICSHYTFFFINFSELHIYVNESHFIFKSMLMCHTIYEESKFFFYILIILEIFSPTSLGGN